MRTFARQGRVPAILATLVITWAALACTSLRGGLTTKPTTPAQEFVVAVAEFNRLAGEANIWLGGVIASARAGDPEAKRYLPVAEQMGRVISLGAQTIEAGQAAFSRGDLEAYLRDGQALNEVISALQAQVLAAGIAGGR